MKKEPEIKKVAVVIITHKEKLNKEEKISLSFLEKNLRKYDKFLVISKSHVNIDSKFNELKFKAIRLEDKYFGTAKRHNDLMKSLEFYNLFRGYEYILKYELDSLVFKDELEYFCSLNYDYIGAPFIMNNLKKIKDIRKIKQRNGGLSLRKINSFVNVLQNNKRGHNLWFIRYYINNFLRYNFFRIRAVIIGKLSIKSIFSIGEDIFWSIGAKEYNPNFKVAPFYVSLSFSFENNVPLSFKMNNRRLPFGCHAFKCEKNLKEWKKLKVI